MAKRWWKESGGDFDFEEGQEALKYETTGSDWIGTTVLRKFGKGGAYGTIESWLPNGVNDGKPLWHNKHDVSTRGAMENV